MCVCIYIFGTSSDCFSITVWWHHMDVNKTHRGKPRWELHKNAAKQILETMPHKMAAVQPLASHHKNHSRKMNVRL